MKQYALVAYDYTDEGALDRRLACRDAHLSRVRELAGQDHFISGGVILNDEGKMIGSNAHFQFASRNDLDVWLKQEPYITQNVWEHIDIYEIRLFNPNS